MDSWSKSAVVGRLAGPLFVAFAALMTFIFGIEFDEEAMKIGVNSTVALLNGLLGLWGFAMSVRSKIRQKQDKETCSL
jgi:uncharacterized membrane protein